MSTQQCLHSNQHFHCLFEVNMQIIAYSSRPICSSFFEQKHILFVSGKWIIDISADGVSSCSDSGVKSDPELKGVIPNSFDHIFSHIARTENQQYLVRASFLEIYMVCFVQNCHLL